MIINNLKVATRNLLHQKFYSFINILGLAIGLAGAILVSLFICEELTYDRSHEFHEQIYRLESFFTISGKEDKFAITAIPVGPTIKTECPEVMEMVRILDAGEQLVRIRDQEFFENDIRVADSTIFDIFSHNFIFGSSEQALTRPNTMVLTQSLAEKYFGLINPVGEYIEFDDGRLFEVTAVIEDLPPNVHVKYSALLSAMTVAEEIGLERFNDTSSGSFWNISVMTFVRLHPDAKIENILEKWPTLYDKYMAEVGNQINGRFELMATNLTRIHLFTDLDWDQPSGNIAYVIIFSAIGIFLLLIASINYMNLATARSLKRAREVGVRKVLGALRIRLIQQFIWESILVSCLALALAMILVVLALPVYNDLVGKTYSIIQVVTPSYLLGLIVLTLSVGFLSGIYPAFYLSGFNPLVVLKGVITAGRGGSIFRQILVVIQFTIFIAMIIGTVTVSQQLQFMREKDLGFQRDNMVVMQMPDTTFASHLPSFKEALRSNQHIYDVGTSTSVPGNDHGKIVFRVDEAGTMVERAINLLFVDHDWLHVMDFQLAEGRFFDREFTSDVETAFIINETAAREFGWEGDALGKRMQFGIDLDGSAARDGVVVGVLEDYHYASLHNNIEPIAIMLLEDSGRMITARISETDIQGTLQYIENLWMDQAPSRPFSYRFLNQILDESYTVESKISTTFNYLTGLAIFIACLGLYGLISYAAEQRTREIGIRKVLGATTASLVYLLSKNFLLLVLLAGFIAISISYFWSVHWLRDFSYQNHPGYTTYILATAIALVIAQFTVSIQAFRAARFNPIKSIKYE